MSCLVLAHARLSLVIFQLCSGCHVCIPSSRVHLPETELQGNCTLTGNRYSVSQVKLPARLDGNHILSLHMFHDISTSKSNDAFVPGDCWEQKREARRQFLISYLCLSMQSRKRSFHLCLFCVKIISCCTFYSAFSHTKRSARVSLQVRIANYLLSCSMRTTLQRMTSVCSNAGVVRLDNSTSRCLPMTCSCSTSLCTLFLVSLRCCSNTQPVGCRQSNTHTPTHRHTPPVG